MNKLFRVALLAFVSLAALASVSAQTATNVARRSAPATQEIPSDPVATPTTQQRTTADENFELDIAERRITVKDYEASTSVETGDETTRGLNLRVGVRVGASNIDVLLRNVRGRVHFRGSLESLLERLNLHIRRPAPVASPTTTPTQQGVPQSDNSSP
jgi:hypothetical protein